MYLKIAILGISSLQIPLLIHLKVPTSSSISEARQRTGSAVMTRLFEMVAKPLATLLTQECFFRWAEDNGIRRNSNGRS